jgi:hypothetical protein
MSTTNSARLDPRTDVRPFSHIRVALESAAYRLAAGGTNFKKISVFIFCKMKGVTAQHLHTPCPVSATVTTAPRNNRSARAGQLQALSSLNCNFLMAGSLRCSAATASCRIFCSPASISGAFFFNTFSFHNIPKSKINPLPYYLCSFWYCMLKMLLRASAH